MAELNVQKNIAALTKLWERVGDPSAFIVSVAESLALQQARAAQAEEQLFEWAKDHRQGNDEAVSRGIAALESFVSRAEQMSQVANRPVMVGGVDPRAQEWRARYVALAAKIDDPAVIGNAIQMVDTAIEMGVALGRPYDEVLGEILKTVKAQRIVAQGGKWYQRLLLWLLKKADVQVRIAT